MGALFETLRYLFGSLAVPIFISPIALVLWWLVSAVMVQLSLRSTTESGENRVEHVVRRITLINIWAVIAGGIVGIGLLVLTDALFLVAYVRLNS